MLIYSGAQILTTLEEREPTPLALACEYGFLDVVRTLLLYSLQDKVVIDPTGPTSSSRLNPTTDAFGFDSSLAEFLIYPWSQMDHKSDPPVVMAVRDSRLKKSSAVKLELLRLLHEYGFDLDQRSPLDGATALTVAVEQNDAKVVNVLLKQYNCRVANVLDISKSTSLHLACQMQHWDLVLYPGRSRIASFRGIIGLEERGVGERARG